MTGINKAQMVRQCVESYPNGTTFTSRDLAQDLKDKYPKINFSSVTLGSILTRYCSDIVSVSVDSRRDVNVYKRVTA
jgi:hypothetical protein